MSRKFSRKRTRQPRAASRFSRLFRPQFEPLEDRRVLALVTVTSTSDTVAQDGVVTLREAILSTNGNSNINADVVGVGAYGSDTIEFAIPANDPGHVYYVDDNLITAGQPNGTVTPFDLGGANILGTTTETDDANIAGIDPDWVHSWYAIRLAGALPDITEAVVIDAYTQTGAVKNTAAISDASTAVLRVELTAATGAEFDGFRVTGGDTTIRGFSIHGFGFFDPKTEHGIELASAGNTVAGNHLGADVSGLAGNGNEGAGVFIDNAADNTIGGNDPGDRNRIAGNRDGIHVYGTGATGNTILGNLLLNHPNGAGVLIANGASQNTVGGAVAAAANVIGSNSTGVRITGVDTFSGQPSGNSSNSNRVQGNYIGTNAHGANLPNLDGVSLNFGALNNEIGGLTSVPGTAPGNLIANNLYGIFIVDPSVSGTIIQGNLIGTNAAGTATASNFYFGVFDGGSATVIGGLSSESRNVISGQRFGGGIALQGSGAVVESNYIGTDITGTQDLGNLGSGIAVDGSNNFIAYNLIAFNHELRSEEVIPGDGILVSSGSGNVILHNSIFANDGLGIELRDDNGADGIPLPNDNQDSDNGANNLQNYPVLLSATNSGGVTLIQGTFNSLPNRSYLLEFFVNDPANLDPSGNGEGQTPLTTMFAGTDANGDIVGGFSFNSPTLVQPGKYITATATLLQNFAQPGPEPQGEGNEVETSEFSNAVPVTAAAGIDLVKTAVANQVANVAGETITYNITVANTGDVPLTGVVVTDPSATTLVRGNDATGNNDATLDVGETWTYTATHTVTQAEIDSNGGGDGDLDNTATVTTTQEFGDSDSATVPVSRSPAVLLVKSASVPGGTANVAGELITYTISVVNTGNTTLTGVAVSDPFVDAGSLQFVSGDGAAQGQLNVGETWVYTATHTVTQAELDSNGGGDGDLDNTASVTTTQGAGDSDSATVAVVQTVITADLELTKTVNNVSPQIGTQVTFTITVTNKGPDTATGVQVTDVLPAGTTLVTATPSQGSISGTSTVVWNVGSLGASSATLTLLVTVPSSPGSIINTAQVTASNQADPDSTPGNSVASEDDQASSTVTAVDPNASGSISGFVYVDVNNNGVKDAQELGLPNVPVTLSGTVSASVVTGADGTYTFSNLPAGTYTVTETQPAAFNDGQETQGTPVLGTIGADKFQNLVLPGGTVLVNYNFGERGLTAAQVSKRLFLGSTSNSQLLAQELPAPQGLQAFSFEASRDEFLSVDGGGEGEGIWFDLYTADWQPIVVGSLRELAAQLTAGQSYVLVVNNQSGSTADLSVALEEGLFSGYTNHANRTDVDHSGACTNLDAFRLISELRTKGASVLEAPASGAAGVPLYLDVNGDGCFTNLDIFTIIAYLREHAPPTGEGESLVPSVISSALGAESVSDGVSSSFRAGSVSDGPLVSSSSIIAHVDPLPTTLARDVALAQAATRFEVLPPLATDEAIDLSVASDAAFAGPETNWLDRASDDLLTPLASRN